MKRCKFASFVRKLYRWGFKQFTKGDNTQWFYHNMFQHGDKSLCMQMRCGASREPWNKPKIKTSHPDTSCMNLNSSCEDDSTDFPLRKCVDPYNPNLVSKGKMQMMGMPLHARISHSQMTHDTMMRLTLPQPPNFNNRYLQHARDLQMIHSNNRMSAPLASASITSKMNSLGVIAVNPNHLMLNEKYMAYMSLLRKAPRFPMWGNISESPLIEQQLEGIVDSSVQASAQFLS